MTLSNTGIKYEKKMYKLKYAPDWDGLKTMINRAKGSERSMRQFASACEISPATFTRIMKGEYKKPLSVEMLKKIVEAAVPDAGVTMPEALLADGYMEECLDAVEENRYTDQHGRLRVSDLYEILVNDLRRRKLPFITYSAGSEEDIPRSKLGMNNFDRYQSYHMLTVHVQGYEPKYHKFHVNDADGYHVRTTEDLWRILKVYSLMLLRDAYEPEAANDYKYIIVFTSDKVFQLFSDVMQSVTVNNSISAILVDKQEQSVRKEFAIPRKDGKREKSIFEEPYKE